jgi:4'-phosphopantetheinyl transferase
MNFIKIKNEIHIWHIDSEAKKHTYNFCQQILSQYINKNPDEIVFTKTQWGKPELQDNQGIFFNLSHAQGLTVLAVADFPGIGIDIEKILPIDSKVGLAESCFSALEFQQMEQIPMEKWEPIFYDYWTRKESVVKAQGKGLFTSLQSFSVSLSKTWTKVKLGDQAWYLKPLTLPRPWVGAVTAERKCQIREYKYSSQMGILLSSCDKPSILSR